MNGTPQSLNCTNLFFDEKDSIKIDPPPPLSPKYLEHLRKQRELYRKYGRSPGDVDPPSPSSDTTQPDS